VNSNHELKTTFKDFKKSMIGTSIVWPIIIVVTAFITLVTGNARSDWIQAVAWVGIGTAVLSLSIYIYCQLTMETKQGFNEVSGNILSRFFLRLSHVVLLTSLGIPATSVLIDHLLGLKKMIPTPYNWLGLLVFIPALGLEIWTLYIFVTRGKGTPVPFEGTQQLITEGPYRYVRNPMVIGTAFMTGGLAIILSSWILLILFVNIVIHFHLYTVKIEEKEMKIRFGPKWEEYKTRVPMWIPRLKRIPN
jgi:protein-S-isoprenylcysteine O-methyltransferase Ste14